MEQNPVVSLQSHKLAFISWATDCSRSDSIARRLGGTSHMIYSPLWGSNYSTILFKYLSQTIKTFWVLFRENPDVVFVMTPPVIACLPVWLYAKLAGARYVIDAHSGAFLDNRWTSTLFLHRFASRHALTTMVTSPFLERMVLAWGARVTIVMDVPICYADPEPVIVKGRTNMTFISTFTRDEPLEEFLKAARALPDIQFYVTGSFKHANPRLLQSKGANVEFTGFLPHSQYVGLLMASDAILSLTTEDHTMQRGAYEAVYLEKPVITSDFEILRTAFNRGTVHVGSTAEDIARGIRQMLQNLTQYSSEVKLLRKEKLNRWQETIGELTSLFTVKHP